MNSEQHTEQLLVLERQRGEALVARDRTLLDALFARELVHVHSTGVVMNKQQLMEYVLTELEFLSVTRSDLVVRIFGEVAVMTGRMRNTMRRVDKTEPITAEAIVTQVWIYEGGRWRQSYFHSCRAA